MFQQIQMRSVNAAGQSEVRVLRPGNISQGVNTHTMYPTSSPGDSDVAVDGGNDEEEIVTDALTLNIHFSGISLVKD